MTTTRADERAAQPRARRRREHVAGWAFASPALLLLAAFLIAPFLFAVVLSFTDQRLVPNPNLPTQWIGLRNYQRMFEDPGFRAALVFNAIFVFVVVPLQSAFALGLAVLVNQKIRFRNFFRTVYFAPVAVTMVVTTVMWAFLLNPNAGIINRALETISFGYVTPERFGILRWFLDQTGARAAVIVISIWQGVGLQMIIFLAGLQTIPAELYAAAQIDGATSWQQFRYVTLPQLRNTVVFVVLATTILSFSLFDQVQILTAGGPQDATQTMVLRLFSVGFSRGQTGLGSAYGVFYFVLVIAVIFGLRRVLREEREIA